MGSNRCTGTRLVAHCCHGAIFGFGFLLTVLSLAVMFWVAWCYFGLTIVQFSDSQRRAVVNYSFTTSKPIPTPTTAPISRSTTPATEETSINSISTTGILRGSSRDASASALPSPRGPSRNKDGPAETAPILTGSSADDSDDRVYVRRVLPPGPENRADERADPIRRNPSDKETASRMDISPTKVYDVNPASGTSRLDDPVTRPVREEARTPPRDYVARDKLDAPRTDDIQSSRRPDSDSAYREPDFDRDYPRKYSPSSDRGRSRYDDDEYDDERGSRGRYDKRDRGRDSDDRYSKGDTRVYPDDRNLPIKPTVTEDRYRDRERYPDDIPKRGNDDKYDDRYRDLDEKSKSRDRDVDRPYERDDRYRDDDRYKSRDDDRYESRDYDRSRDRDDTRYRYRDDERYKSRDDERYKSRDDDSYRSRDGDYYRPRDEDRYRYRDDVKYRPRDEYRYKDEDRYRVREEDRYKTRDDGRYQSDAERRSGTVPRPRVDEERYRPRGSDDKYVEPSTSRMKYLDAATPVGDRIPTASRADYDVRVRETVTDYDVPSRDRPRPYPRDDKNSRPVYDDNDRYRGRDESYQRPSGYEDDSRNISPTRTRDDSSFSRSALIDSRPKDGKDDSRYADASRDRIRDDRYYDQDDRIRSTRLQDSRSFALASDSSGRYTGDSDRYRTRLPIERIDEPKLSDRREEPMVDRRSYASKEDDQYKSGNSRTVNTYDGRSRSPVDEGRYRDEERYPRRDPVDDDDYKRSKPLDDFDRDTVRSRDRYDDKYRRDDDRYASRNDDRYPPKVDRPPVRNYDSYPDEEPRPSRRDSERGTKIDNVRDRVETLRASSSSRDEDRLYNRDVFAESKSSPRSRYGDDYKDHDADNRRYSTGSVVTANAKETMSVINSREPSDVVIRDKRYDSSDTKYQSDNSESSRSNDKSQTNTEAKSTEQQMRPPSTKDVIEAANRHSDTADQNARKVYYPVFDPRISNLTSPEIIRPSERKGTIITARRRRHA